MQGEDRVYLAYTKATRPTGRNMAKVLGIPSYGIRPAPYALDVLIRWGSRKPMPPADVVLNNASAIGVASDKIAAINAMMNAGVTTVPYFTTYREAREFTAGIVFGRSRTGYGGKDIVVYHPGDIPEQEHDFYTPYIRSTRELRIHVVGDKVVRIQGKYLDHPELDRDGLIRNHAHGYRFRSPRLELRPQRRQQAISAVTACGLDFGAVDMLLQEGGGASYILEVNTAPSCSPLTARCYAGELALLIERKTRGAVRIAPDILEIEDEYYEEEENA